MKRTSGWVVAWLTLVALVFFGRTSFAAPQAHILRIDPRAGVQDGQPLLTTVIELVQFTPMGEVITNAGCGAQKGDAVLDCISNALEQKNVMWKAFQFPDPGARLLVRTDTNTDNPAKLASKTTWGAATKDPLVGTAWLVALDASSLMGPRYSDAREVANQFISALGPNDIAKLVIFDDRISPYVANSTWIAAAQKAQLISILQANASPSPSHQRQRPLFNTIKNITKSFGDLGNVGGLNVPMHQAMVLLSNGSGREDASSAAITADAMKQYLLKGRFPEDNPLSPKTPLPVISIYFPNAKGFANDVYALNDMQFMEDISTPEIGGYFDIVRAGQGVAKATTIISLVKSRFNAMWVVKWRLSCLQATPEQTFNLVFQGGTPITPDGSFKDIPIGIDPTNWPLDINMAQTKAEADANPVHPGGTFRVYGDFCWGGDKGRAEAYFVPAGTNPNQQVNTNDPDLAKKAIQNLVAQNLRGGAVEAADTFVQFNVPDEEKLLEGEGDNTVAHVVVYDNKAKRGSGVTAQTVITLKAGKKPLNLPIILGAAGIVVVILLLVVVLLRGGGGGRGKPAAPPPQPIVAGPPNPYGGPGGYGGGQPPPYGGGGGGYGPPPGGGYGGPPQGGGGYGGPPQGGGYSAPQEWTPPAPPPGPLHPPPPVGGGGYPLAVAGGAPVEVRCPACGQTTPAMVGQASVCFSCGQPLPLDIAVSAMAPPPAAVAAAPSFPLTSAHQAAQPPPNPYGAPATAASIVGAAGQFAIRSGVEVRIGRDPAACPIMLSEPRVSGVHATLKFEAGQLMVRDEGSNNGTYVGGARLPAHVWTVVAAGVSVRFGPVDFTVRLD